MGKIKLLAVVVCLLTAVSIVSAKSGPDAGLKRCSKTTMISDTATGATGGDTLTDLTTEPAIVCSVDFIALAATAWAEVYSSPQTGVSGEISSAKQEIAEPGEATAGNSHTSFFGDNGRLTNWGLSARVRNGHLIVHWDD